MKRLAAAALPALEAPQGWPIASVGQLGRPPRGPRAQPARSTQVLANGSRAIARATAPLDRARYHKHYRLEDAPHAGEGGGVSPAASGRALLPRGRRSASAESKAVSYCILFLDQPTSTPRQGC